MGKVYTSRGGAKGDDGVAETWHKFCEMSDDLDSCARGLVLSGLTRRSAPEQPQT